MDSILCDDMVKIEKNSRTSMKTLAAMRCINKDVEKDTYEPYLVDLYKKRNNIVSGFIMQFSLSCSNYINKFAPSRRSSSIDLGFLPRDGRILASSEQGIIVYESRPYLWNSYFVCKPATKQVVRLPNPKAEYVTQNIAIVVLGSSPYSPLHYKILRISETQNPMELTRDECYMTYRCEIFDSRTWAWKELNRLILPESAHLDNPQLPITTSGSICMKLRNLDVLKFDVYSEKWSVFSSPTSTLEYDQFCTRRELVKHEGRLGYICKPPNGDWETWVLGMDETWEKMNVIKEEEEDNNSGEVSFTDPNTIIKIYSHTCMFYKGNNAGTVIPTDGSQMFVYGSDLEPTNLMGDWSRC